MKIRTLVENFIVSIYTTNIYTSIYTTNIFVAVKKVIFSSLEMTKVLRNTCYGEKCFGAMRRGDDSILR